MGQTTVIQNGTRHDFLIRIKQHGAFCQWQPDQSRHSRVWEVQYFLVCWLLCLNYARRSILRLVGPLSVYIPGGGGGGGGEGIEWSAISVSGWQQIRLVQMRPSLRYTYYLGAKRPWRQTYSSRNSLVHFSPSYLLLFKFVSCLTSCQHAMHLRDGSA